MKGLLFIFSIFFSLQAMSETRTEALERQEMALRDKELKQTHYTRVNSENCDDSIRITKEVQKIIAGAKNSNEGALPLLTMERDYHALKSQLVIYEGLDKINNEYKKFLTEVGNLPGWTAPPGLSEDGSFSIEELKSDIETSKKNLETVDTMAFMDRLLKDAMTKEQNGVARTLLEDSTSGESSFDQLKSRCASDASTGAHLCQILKGISPGGEAEVQLEATVEGFVKAFKTSGRTGMNKALTSIFRDDLQNYRNQLLKGLDGITPSDLKGEIQTYRDSIDTLSDLSENNSRLNSIASDLNNYQACLTAKSLAAKTAKECKLEKSFSVENEDGDITGTEEYLNVLNALDASQKDLVSQLGGENEAILKKMDIVHQYGAETDRLNSIKTLYEGQPKFNELINSKIATNKAAIDSQVKVILSSIYSDKQASDVATSLNGGTEENRKEGENKSAYEVFIEGRATLGKKDNAKKLLSMSDDLNKKMKEVRCAHNPSNATEEDPGLTTRSKCEDAKDNLQIFVQKGDKVEVDPDQLEEYLKELNEGELDKNTKTKIAETKTEMKNLKENIDALRNSDKYSTLNELLSYHAGKVEKNCSGRTGKEFVRCTSAKKGSNENVISLVNSAGTILASMPESPTAIAVSDLNKSCDTAFIDSFNTEEQKIIAPLCTGVMRDNENLAKALEPTPKEVRNKTNYDYWDGTKWVSETRQRNRWIVTQAVAGGAINFLPTYLGHQVQKTGIETWEASTIEGIKYRNGMLSDYYTYGINGYNGYFGGSPDYLSNWGGSIFNNGFQTVGAGGYFGFTQPATVSATTGTSTGFQF